MVDAQKIVSKDRIGFPRDKVINKELRTEGKEKFTEKVACYKGEHVG